MWKFNPIVNLWQIQDIICDSSVLVNSLQMQSTFMWKRDPSIVNTLQMQSTFMWKRDPSIVNTLHMQSTFMWKRDPSIVNTLHMQSTFMWKRDPSIVNTLPIIPKKHLRKFNSCHLFTDHIIHQLWKLNVCQPFTDTKHHLWKLDLCQPFTDTKHHTYMKAKSWATFDK